ncbi:outer membrane lipoprotein-sorting protein [bacterium]|nr:outer membrane lipoprotein-sorting protein [bacterium]MBU1435196.1 outer membrane lipoprotein-sorting protein [bacterium]MBU1502853.1 outer membrane lipoprotein-sorting protein [bacterium]
MRTIFLILGLGVTLFAETSLEVAKKSYEVISGYESSVSKTTMILKNAQGAENIRKLEIKKLEGKEGDKSLITFLYPLDIKETKLLSYEKVGEDDEQWLYLPALKRVKRISSSNKSGSFMASEFSYEDISSQNYNKYTYEGDAQKTTLENSEYFKITRVPKDENSAYSKQIVYIDTKSYLVKYGEYYDKQEKLLKLISFLEYENLDGVYRIKKMQMKNVQTNKSSLLIWDEDIIKTLLSENEFSQRGLK